MLDFTPARLNYMAEQAIKLDRDMMEKVDMVLRGLFGAFGAPAPAPGTQKSKTQAEHDSDLKKMGFTIRREK